jgi:hypothetical protein
MSPNKKEKKSALLLGDGEGAATALGGLIEALHQLVQREHVYT